ncbi:hypothetical protein [Streptomyces poriticola]|uniref:hypothetical protein n=1 Tax=Streptomyces poriticola TaxID=3120506 RepID=UPI002FCDEB8B
MRSYRRPASAAVAVAFVIALPFEVLAHARVGAPERARGPERAHAAGDDSGDSDAPEQLFGSTCRVRIKGSRVTAYCHNPYPEPDRVSLHVECARWWDVDSDSTPVTAGPAQTVRLDGRCWKEVRTAWVSHRRER